MLHELLPVSRGQISMEMLPDRIKWQHAENIMGLESGRAFTARERSSGRSVLGTSMGTHLLYTHLDAIPLFSGEASSGPWRVADPEWRLAERPVDMRTTVDLGYMDSRYIETSLGSPLALFVKGTLLRSRLTSGFHSKVQTLLRTPQELAQHHSTKSFPLQGHTEAFLQRIDGQHGEILERSLMELKQAETQLQIVLHLELLDASPGAASLEGVVDAHFDRLLLWQTLGDNRQDMVVDFCTQVVWPFYRATHRKKAEQLYFRAKGKRERISKEQKKRKEEATKEDTKAIMRSVSLLERARSLRFTTVGEPSKAESQPSLRKSSVKPSKHTLRREIEVSFKSKPVAARSATSRAGTPQPAKRIQTHGPSVRAQTASYQPTIHVFATPVANRRIVLDKEQINLPDLEIESTDEDE